MNDLRGAAQQALEALDAGVRISPKSILHGWFRAALAQQDEPCPNCASLEAQNTELDRKLAELERAEPVQEPMAWMVYTVDGKSAYVTDNPSDIKEGQSAYALYPGPFERQPLTEQEIHDCFHAARNAKLGAPRDNSKHRLSVVEIARAVERAHGIGEQP